MDKPTFSDSSASDNRAQGLLDRRICDLSLKIEGTILEPLIKQLYSELGAAGLVLRPKTYLSDEWGCPDRVPAIGIPFYLADRDLCEMEGKFTGVEAETTAEVMMYLRHEAGHAFNYAYRLYERPGWRRTFGRFSVPYGEIYPTRPFSMRFVRNIPGWYAQKHPDEDFAETFAVWLDPTSNWRIRYAGTPALKKLLYVERLVSRYGAKPPEVTGDRAESPVQDLNITLDNWYRSGLSISLKNALLPGLVDNDLLTLFPGKGGTPAADLLENHHRDIIRHVNAWTGIERHLLYGLISELVRRARSLNLKVDPAEQEQSLIAAVAFVTTLATNYQLRGTFVET